MSGAARAQDTSEPATVHQFTGAPIPARVRRACEVVEADRLSGIHGLALIGMATYCRADGTWDGTPLRIIARNLKVSERMLRLAIQHGTAAGVLDVSRPETGGRRAPFEWRFLDPSAARDAALSAASRAAPSESRTESVQARAAFKAAVSACSDTGSGTEGVPDPESTAAAEAGAPFEAAPPTAPSEVEARDDLQSVKGVLTAVRRAGFHVREPVQVRLFDGRAALVAVEEGGYLDAAGNGWVDVGPWNGDPPAFLAGLEPWQNEPERAGYQEASPPVEPPLPPLPLTAPRRKRIDWSNPPPGDRTVPTVDEISCGVVTIEDLLFVGPRRPPSTALDGIVPDPEPAPATRTCSECHAPLDTDHWRNGCSGRTTIVDDDRPSADWNKSGDP